MYFFSKRKITTKFMMIMMSMILFLGITFFTITYFLVKNTLEQTAVQNSNANMELSIQYLDSKYPGDWKLKENKLYKGNVIFNGNNEVVDHLALMSNDSVLIFQRNTSIATNITQNGKRIIGSKAPETITTILKSGKKYAGETTFADNQYQAVYVPIKDKNGNLIGILFMGQSESQVMKEFNKMIMLLFIIFFIFIVIPFIVSKLFTRDIKLRLNRLSEALQHAGKGDFSREVIDKSDDEISLLTASYGAMRKNLSTLVGSVQQMSEQVAAASEQLHASSDETKKAADIIATSVQEVATSNDKQTEFANHLEQTIYRMIDGIKTISNNSISVKQSTEKHANEAKNGESIMQQTVEQVNMINQTNQSASKTINHLGEKSKEIGEIINIITEISSQTNLLALNAAIEAARAGENGRGFAVVADEVKTLAEQSKISANQIRNLIEDIQQGIAESVHAMEEGGNAISKGIGLVSDAGTSFATISTSIQQVNEDVEKISKAIHDVKDGTNEMADIIHSTVSMIHSTAGASQSVAASAEEQNATMQEINASAELLNKLSEQMSVQVSQFIL